MDAKGIIFDELIKNGYARTNGNKIWDIAEKKFLYMTPELAKGFLNLKNFDIYKSKIIDLELDLMGKNAKKVLDKLDGENFNLIDVGCGEGKKAMKFIEEFGKHSDAKIKYCPVSFSKYLLDLASKNIESSSFKNVSVIEKNLGTFKELGEIAGKLRSSDYQKNVVILMGSILASFEINDFLFELSNQMFPGDYLIIGNGIRTGERLTHLETYQNPIWDKWFIKLIELIGFSKEDVEYDARFANSRVEGFYKLNKNKTLTYKDKKVGFKKGDEILVSIMYKYYQEELEKFCKMYFSEVELVKDEDNEYALVLCKK